MSAYSDVFRCEVRAAICDFSLASVQTRRVYADAGRSSTMMVTCFGTKQFPPGMPFLFSANFIAVVTEHSRTSARRLALSTVVIARRRRLPAGRLPPFWASCTGCGTNVLGEADRVGAAICERPFLLRRQNLARLQRLGDRLLGFLFRATLPGQVAELLGPSSRPSDASRCHRSSELRSARRGPRARCRSPARSASSLACSSFRASRLQRRRLDDVLRFAIRRHRGVTRARLRFGLSRVRIVRAHPFVGASRSRRLSPSSAACIEAAACVASSLICLRRMLRERLLERRADFRHFQSFAFHAYRPPGRMKLRSSNRLRDR